MSSIINYFKDRAHRLGDYPNVIMNYWNRSTYVKPAVLLGSAVLSDRIGGQILPPLLKTICENHLPGPFIVIPAKHLYDNLPVKPAILSQLATIVFGFGLAASAHKNQISHLSEPEIQKATFWRRFGKTLGFIGGTFLFAPLPIAATAAKTNVLANAETISESDDVENNPLDPDFEPCEEMEEASEAVENASEEAGASDSDQMQDVDEKRSERDERDLFDHSDEKDVSSSSSLSSSSSRLEEAAIDEMAEVEDDSSSSEADLESETSDDEENEELLRTNRQQGVVIYENRQLRPAAMRRMGWEASAESKLKRIVRPLTNLCKKSAPVLVAATAAAVAASIFSLCGGWEAASETLQTYALEAVLSIAVPATGIWISPSSLGQQPELAAGAASVLGTLIANYPRPMLAATSIAAVAKLGSIAKDYFFTPEPQPAEPGQIQE